MYQNMAIFAIHCKCKFMLKATMFILVFVWQGLSAYGQWSVGLGAGLVTFTEKVTNVQQVPGWTLNGGGTLENDQPYFLELNARYQKNKNVYSFSVQTRSIYYYYSLINEAGFGYGSGHGNDLLLNLQLSYGRKILETGKFSIMPMAGLGMATANGVSQVGTGSFGTTDLENNLLTGTDSTYTALSNALSIPLSLVSTFRVSPDISINLTFQFGYNLSPYFARETVNYTVQKNSSLVGSGSGYIDQKNTLSFAVDLSYHFGKKPQKKRVKNILTKTNSV